MKKIFLAGHRGMVGGAICRQLKEQSDVQIITRTRAELDLCNQSDVLNFVKAEKPDEIILAAAKVGGIYANNTYPAEFIYENLQIQNNVINAAHLSGVHKLLFLGSSCIYPKQARQPISEERLMTGALEPSNEPYAIAKIAGIKMCESYTRQFGRDYRSVMPTNLYGPGDNFHAINSHVVPALIRRFHEAKTLELNEVVIWGSGQPRREFLHVDDMANASLFIHSLPRAIYDSVTDPALSHINVGTGIDLTILELSELIASTVGFKGTIVLDKSKPDGTMRKLLDVSKLNKLGWSSNISLNEGLVETYEWFLQNEHNHRQ